MAILDLDLSESGTRTITSDDTNGDSENTLNITALGGSELIVDGVSANIGSVVGVQVGATPTFTATNGGDLTVDSGFISVDTFNSTTYNIEGDSQITLNASSVSTLSGLNGNNVNFSGSESGSFTFNKPDIAIADTTNFDVTGMKAGDELNLGGGDWSLDEEKSGGIFGSGIFGGESDGGYRDGALHLTQGNSAVGGQVNATIEMSQEEYEQFQEDPDAYLSGNTFTQVCFAAGTMIATPEGEVAVETLSIGDMVMTASGDQVPVKWIGHQTIKQSTVSTSQAPVRVSKDALAQGQPNQDLVLTASHGLIIDDLVINAGALINHDSIDYVPSNELPASVTYYHVETDAHEVIIANGIEAETYIDYIDRQVFDNYAEYVALYGIETRVVEMPRHRISSRRLLPLAVRERLGIQDIALAAKTA